MSAELSVGIVGTDISAGTNTGLAGVKVAVIGGDRRQLAVISALSKMQAQVRYYALPPWPELAGLDPAENLIQAVSNAHIILLPINGTDPEGQVRTVENIPAPAFTRDILKIVPVGALLAIGSLRPLMRSWAEEFGIKTLEYGETDEIAVLNSIPTAEGALQVAMEELPVTIHGCSCFVLGFGRCGITLARMLHALDAKTTVFARRPAQLARAHAMGLNTGLLTELPGRIGSARLIYNTIPAMVIPEELLVRTDPGVLIVDISSAPGGVDFSAAGRLGRKALLSLGLPGKVAPETAGNILASALPGLIMDALASR